MAVVYVRVVQGQEERPAAWVLVVLAAGVCLCGYGARRRAAHRRVALTIAGVGLLLLGVLGIMSIGLPILAAGTLALAAGTRAAQQPTGA